MATIEQVIKDRRSIRRFEKRDVPDELLTKLYEAVRWAPSWANTQCWELVVVRNPETKKVLADTLTPKNPGIPAVKNAPVVAALCAKLKTSGYYKGQILTKFGDWFMYDLGLATQNLCLAAHELGLGSVIVGAFDHDKVKKILEIPHGYEVVSLIPIGYPAKIPSAPQRKKIKEFVHQERF